jgi:ABC-type proline/glycine betaine transport system permease subunit
MAITRKQLDRAGWCSITNALIAIPSLAMSWFLETVKGIGPTLSQVILTVVGLGLFLYVIYSFKRLLNGRFKFHDVDIYISLMIWGNVVLAVLSLLSLETGKLESFMETITVAALIVFGILSIMFATRLLRLSGNLYGLLRAYCYTTILSGIFLITVFLLPVAILAGAVADVILGVIFFRAAEQTPQDEILSTPIE